jgi:hypothetical protein
MKELKIRPLTEEERKYTYAQSTQLDGQTGNIGCLRGDFGSSGNQFFTTWAERWDKYKTDVFRESLDDVVNTLRSGEYGLLQDRTAMTGYVMERQTTYFIILHNRLSPLFSHNSTLHYDVLFYQ